MDIKKLFSILVLVGASIYVSSCGEDEGTGGTVDFDREALLENVGNKLILTGYSTLQEDINSLQTKVTDFNTSPTTENLGLVKSTFQEAYLSWQAVSFYEFGPAFDVLLRSSLNTFPTKAKEIDRNIEEGGYNLDAIPNVDAKGFPAIDYLLYSAAEEEIVARFENDSKVGTYLADVVANMKTKVDAVVTAWSAGGGNYIGEFISRTGTDAGSSVGLLVNELNRHYEVNTRDKKIGIPLGVRSLDVPLPDDVEARYSEQSINLALANLNAIKQLFEGGEGEAIGFDDYLKELNAGQGTLHTSISSQFDAAIAAVELIPEPYSETVSNNPEQAKTAYTELQKLVVLLKADMPSALGVLITYQDNDGD